MTEGAGRPEGRGERFKENAFIGCMYFAVGIAALALFLMFGQVIFRMFWM